MDSDGKTLDFLLTAHQNAEVTKRFLGKTLKNIHIQAVRVINVDNSAAYPKAIDEFKGKKEIFENIELW